ncbi:hypothetical protein HK100_001490 [Physocladia obscura]|uniref:Bromodomain-containing protein n=1 Tax=Physocladia obscura TaxID=109957 RepID=A0AAD5T2R5_9FUNG|nr:hypothetical protein HK100_001490 [Physocladia obscura]
MKRNVEECETMAADVNANPIASNTRPEIYNNSNLANSGFNPAFVFSSNSNAADALDLANAVSKQSAFSTVLDVDALFEQSVAHVSLPPIDKHVSANIDDRVSKRIKLNGKNSENDTLLQPLPIEAVKNEPASPFGVTLSADASPNSSAQEKNSVFDYSRHASFASASGSNPDLVDTLISQQKLQKQKYVKESDIVPCQLSQQQTPLDKLQLKFCKQFMSKVKRVKMAEAFLHPVDPIKWNIPTYFSVIKHPMDLSTIQKKLDSGSYVTAQTFKDDLNLMLNNCWDFNGKDSHVGKSAVKLQIYVTKQFQDMPYIAEDKSQRYKPQPNHKSQSLDRPKREPQPRNSLSPTRKLVSKHSIAELKHAEAIVRELMKPKYASFALPFLLPVDYVNLNIPSYPHIIKYPMDFGTILSNLENKKYTSLAEFESDARLVFRNCYTFNLEGSEIYEMGKKLEQVFEKKLKEKPSILSLPIESSTLGVVTESTKSIVNNYVDDDDDDNESNSNNDNDDCSDSSSDDEKAQRLKHLMKMMDNMTSKLASATNGDTKVKNAHKKAAKVQELIEQQKRVLESAAAVVVAPKKKKSRSKSDQPLGVVNEISLQQKMELTEKIQFLTAENMTTVFQIIGLDSQADSQTEIELDMDSVDCNTLYKLYHFVINAMPSATRKKSSGGTGNETLSDGKLSGFDTDSDSSSSTSSSDVFEGGAETISNSLAVTVPKAAVTTAPEVTVTATAKQANTSQRRQSATPASISKGLMKQQQQQRGTLKNNSIDKSAPPLASTVASGGTLKQPQSSATVASVLVPAENSVAKRTELKFKKSNATSTANGSGNTGALMRKSNGAINGNTSVDVFGYIEELEKKKGKEQAEQMKLHKEREEERKADLVRWVQERKPTSNSYKPSSVTSSLQASVDLIPTREERLAQYEKSMERFAGKWLDLHRQGLMMQEFDEMIRSESSPKYEMQLSKEREMVLDSAGIIKTLFDDVYVQYKRKS